MALTGLTTGQLIFTANAGMFTMESSQCSQPMQRGWLKEGNNKAK